MNGSGGGGCEGGAGQGDPFSEQNSMVIWSFVQDLSRPSLQGNAKLWTW